MVVLGGFDGSNALDGGARYQDGTWTAVLGGLVGPRYGHSAVWLQAANAVMVWGGRDDDGVLDAGILLYGTGSALGPVSTVLAPRVAHTAVSTGDQMLVWGGLDAGNRPLGDGAVYTAFRQ